MTFRLRTTRTALAILGLTAAILLGVLGPGCSGGGSGGQVAVVSPAAPAPQPPAPVPGTLNFLVQPSNSQVGQPIAPAIQVEVLDAQNSRVDYTGLLTLFLQAHASQATLTGTLTVPAVGGVATFGDVRVAGAGTGFRLVASGAGTPPVTSAPFDVTLEDLALFENMALLHPTGNGATDVASADFNGDSLPDFAVVNAFDNTVSLRLGTAEGWVVPPAMSELVTGGRPTMVLLGDVDGNQTVDLVVLHRSSQFVRIFPGNGDGTVAPATDLVVSGETRGGALADLDGDGDLDMALAIPFSDAARVYLNDGAGVFSETASLPASRPVQVASAELNGDGFLDLVVTNDSSDSIRIHFGDGTGQFPTNTSIATLDRPRHTLPADLDGDGDRDLVVTHLNSTDLTILMGDGAGGFTSSTVPAGDRPYWSAAADFDGDGELDLAVSNQGGGTVRILRGDGTGSFTEIGVVPAGADPHTVVAVDYNHDGRTDLAVASQEADGLGLVPNLATGFAAWDHLGQTDNTFVVARDFTGDGHLDLVASERDNNRLALWPGIGDGTFGTPAFFPVASRPQEIAVGDFDGSGSLDLAVAAFNANQVSVLLGDGAGGFGAATHLATLNRPFSVATGDLNGDGFPDLAVSHRDASFVRVFRGDGTGAFPTQEDLALVGGSESVALRIGDANDDGRPDLVVGERWGSDNRLRVFVNTGSALVGEVWAVLFDEPRYLSLADLDLDGILDVALSFRYSENIAYQTLISNGSALTVADIGVAPGLNDLVHCMEAVDLNADTLPDLVGTDQGGTLLLFLGVGGGHLVPLDFEGSRLLAGSDPFHVALADFNEDGLPDFAVANHNENGGGTGGITILLHPPQP